MEDAKKILEKYMEYADLNNGDINQEYEYAKKERDRMKRVLAENDKIISVNPGSKENNEMQYYKSILRQYETACSRTCSLAKEIAKNKKEFVIALYKAKLNSEEENRQNDSFKNKFDVKLKTSDE